MELDNPVFIFYFYVILFLIIYIVNYVFDYLKIKKNKTDNIMITSYIIKKFKVDKNKINFRKELKWMTLINSFIITSVGTFVAWLDTYIIVQLGLGFVLLFMLIYSLYEIYGRHLVKKVMEE